MANALTEGVIVLPEGDGSVLSITPPACIHEQQLDHALDVIERLLRRA
jgi:4-aminobutyrate aminotransferase-like enzyme